MKDTRSSNGTFVNDYRLSPANEISQKHEIFSGDCVKFGVEVTEKKQVYSCIIATIRLFLPDGSEARQNPLNYDYNCHENQMNLGGQGGSIAGGNAGSVGGGGGGGNIGFYSSAYMSASVNVSPAQLVELSFFIKDALHKQHLLDAQLEASKEVIHEALMAAKANYRSMNTEEQLLQRIETLQAKLETYLVSTSQAKKITDETKVTVLQEQLLTLISDKDKQDEFTKKAMQDALDQKTATMAKLNALEMEYQTKETECSNLNLIIADNMKEITSLMASCDRSRKEADELLIKLRLTKEEQSKTLARFERERIEMNDKLASFEKRETELRICLARKIASSQQSMAVININEKQDSSTSIDINVNNVDAKANCKNGTIDSSKLQDAKQIQTHIPQKSDETSQVDQFSMQTVIESLHGLSCPFILVCFKTNLLFLSN